MPKKLLPPIHPGEILREEFMKPLGLSANALAQRLLSVLSIKGIAKIAPLAVAHFR